MDQLAEVNNNQTTEEFWREHMLASKSFIGTNSEYCRVHGLDKKKFSYFRRRLGFGKPRPLAKAFVEVRPQNFEEVVKQAPKKSMPDAKWLAEFAVSLLATIK